MYTLSWQSSGVPEKYHNNNEWRKLASRFVPGTYTFRARNGTSFANSPSSRKPVLKSRTSLYRSATLRAKVTCAHCNATTVEQVTDVFQQETRPQWMLMRFCEIDLAEDYGLFRCILNSEERILNSLSHSTSLCTGKTNREPLMEIWQLRVLIIFVGHIRILVKIEEK
jgi:hypothetical protein